MSELLTGPLLDVIENVCSQPMTDDARFAAAMRDIDFVNAKARARQRNEERSAKKAAQKKHSAACKARLAGRL